MKIIDKNKFNKIVLSENIKPFLANINSFIIKMIIDQVRKKQIVLILIKKIPIMTKYLYFIIIFSKISAKILSK